MSGQPWPAGLAVSEGVANARSGRWVSLIVVIFVAWATAGAGLANALEVSALARAEEAWILAGAFVMSVEPAATEASTGIDVAACERLSEVEGISAAFAMALTTATISPANAPGTHATLMDVSPGLYSFLGVREPNGAGLIATGVGTRKTGLANGEEAVFTRTEDSGASATFRATTVIVDRSDLGPSLEGSFMLPTLLTGRADSCRIRTDAAHASAVPGYASQVLSGPNGTPAIVRPLLSENTHGLDFTTAYSTRILRWAWAGAAAALAALWAVVQRTRRNRHAIYQTFGMHTGARVIMQLSEWATLSIPGIAWGWGIAMAAAIGAGADPAISLIQITLHVIAAWCAASIAVIIAALAPVGTLLEALKDRS